MVPIEQGLSGSGRGPVGWGEGVEVVARGHRGQPAQDVSQVKQRVDQLWKKAGLS